MARSALAFACTLVSLLGISSAALATSPCSEWLIADAVEGREGKWMCYERREGFPVYYDAPGRAFRSLDHRAFRPVQDSMTVFEASTVEAMGAVSINDLCNPFPPGQGERDFEPQ